MKNILFICPGGQTHYNSPSERLARYINNNYADLNIDMFNQKFKPVGNVEKKYDLVWGDMDALIKFTVNLAKKLGLPCYIHGEWIPPYNFEEGWEEIYNRKSNVVGKEKCLETIQALQKADLVSLAIDSSPGGFDWIKDRTGIEFKNKFVRYPACKEYPLYEMKKKNQVATIARVGSPLKRVPHNAKACLNSKHKPKFVIIGGDIYKKNPQVKCLGVFNTDDKVKIFSESKIAIQHWSGIPPAEAIQQLCPVLSYDIPYMKELYGDGLIWVKMNDLEDLTNKLDYWLSHDKERKEFAHYTREQFLNNKYSVKMEKHRAELVVNKIRELL